MPPACGGGAVNCPDRFRRSTKPAPWPKNCCGSSGMAQRCSAGHGCSTSQRISACPASRPSRAGRTVPVFAFGLAARPALVAAVRSAILEMCQLELADAVVATKRSERGDDARQRPGSHPSAARARSMPIGADCCSRLRNTQTIFLFRATEAGVIFKLIVQRLERLGIETFCLDLTRQRFAVPVVRVMAPGLQLEPSEIVTARLQDMIAGPEAVQPIPGYPFDIDWAVLINRFRKPVACRPA